MLLIPFLCLVALAGDEEIRLPGSDVTASLAVRAADLVITARLNNSGVIIGSHGKMYCSGFEVMATSVIKGGPSEPTTRKISFEATRAGIGMKRGPDSENLPRIGDEYIFFIRKHPKGDVAIKVLPKTSENIRIVKDLVTGLTDPD